MLGFKDLLFNVENKIATLTLNRPDVFNALSDDMRLGMKSAVDYINDPENDVRVVVITGSGKAFCSGGDIKLMKQRIDQCVSYRERLDTYRQDVSNMVLNLVSIKQPVIARLNGATYGAGCSIAMLADIRICADHVKFGVPFSKRGLIPDWGSTYFLPRLVGLSKAVELVSTGNSFDAQEAFRIGFVNQVVAADQLDVAVETMCNQILQSGPFSVFNAKQAMRDALGTSLETAVEKEAHLQSLCYRSDDHREGVESFLEKRPASFKGI